MELCGAKDENDVEAHDKWLIDLWNKTVGKKDEVIIVGDFSFLSTEDTKKLMGKLMVTRYSSWVIMTILLNI